MTGDTIVRPMNFTLPEHWGAAIAAWGKYLRSASKPPTTLYLREYQLRRFAADHPQLMLVDITLDVLTMWLASFEWKPETRRSYRAALRSFFDWAHITGRITTNPAGLLPRISLPDAQPRPAPEAYFVEALRSADSRVALMVELAGLGGLRRGEIAKVHTRDVESDPDGYVLLVQGKGGTVRRVPLLPGLAGELHAMPEGYIFPGQIEGHLSPHYVGKLISGVLPPGWAAHSLRHRFGSKFYETERDIRATQTVLGHKSVRTTQIYTKVPAGALWRGMQGVGLDMSA